ncbi:LINE-1 retrotransposable element ORF1 protein [Plecturocebus cupreus]
MTEGSVKRNEQSLQEMWDYVKGPSLRLVGVPECDEEDESKLENTLQDIVQENFPSLARQANIQVQEIQRTPQRYSSRRATPRHIIVRFTRVEMRERMLGAAREKGRVTHKGKPIRLTADLSAETLQARREWGPTFNILKENNFQPRISYPAKLSFISEGKIKFFADKQVLRDYITTRPALQELLKEALHMDGNNQYQPFQKHTKRSFHIAAALNRNLKYLKKIKEESLALARESLRPSKGKESCSVNRLECSGMILAHRNLRLLDSRRMSFALPQLSLLSCSREVRASQENEWNQPPAGRLERAGVTDQRKASFLSRAWADEMQSQAKTFERLNISWCRKLSGGVELSPVKLQFR